IAAMLCRYEPRPRTPRAATWASAGMRFREPNPHAIISRPPPRFSHGPHSAKCVAAGLCMCYPGPNSATQLDMDNSVLDRRAFLLGAGALAALLPILGDPASAQEAAQTWEEMVKKVAGDAKPATDSRFTFELPEIAENGNMVPFTIGMDGPMTEDDHVKAIHVIATATPQPSVAH